MFLKQIFIYPVKSCAGIEVTSWPVHEKGLLYDRKWMLIDAQNQFLSQRRVPQMTLIKTALTDTELLLSAPGMQHIALPLAEAEGEQLLSQIWHDQCLACTVSAEVDEWCSEFLKQPCRLVYQAEQTIRRVAPSYARPSDKVYFSDGFPFLLISQASLDRFNRETGLGLSMLRFRPNLVIDSCDAYAEDSWRKIRIGSIDFRLPKPCSRCTVPGIDPDNAETNKQVLQHLSQLRQWQHKVYFGQNALHDQTGYLSVGDAVTIKGTGVAKPPL